MLQTKKSFKQDPIKRSIFKFPPFIKGCIFLYGRIEAGKTTAMMSISSKYHDYRNIKTFDIWGGERNQGENLYWIIPSPYKEYWNYIKKRFRFNQEGPKQYRVNLLYPLFNSMPDELPYLEKYVFPKPFTIPIKEIEIKHINLVLGTLSDENETIWEEIKQDLDKNDGIPELMMIFKKKNATNTSLYKNFVAPLCNYGIFSSLNDGNNLDIAKEVRDKKTVSVLVHHYIPEKFKLFIMGFLLNRMYDLSCDGKIRNESMLNMREASKFFRATEKSIIEERFKIFKNQLRDFIRYARGKMHFNFDTQSPAETRGIMDGNQDITIIGKLPSTEDRAFVTDQFRKDGKMTSNQITKLGELEKGEYYFIETGKFARLRYMFLPRTDFWRENHGNFYDYWRNLRGDSAFKKFKNLKEERFNLARKRFKELEKVERDKHQKVITEKKEKSKIDEESKEKEKFERYERELREKEKIRNRLKREKNEVKKEKPVVGTEEIEDKNNEEITKDEDFFEDLI